jgi:hypothetical protein
MTPSLSLEKLDGRHKGLNRLKYRILVQGPRTEKFQDFLQVRRWCWETWGPSCEREIFLLLAQNNVESMDWAWHFDEKWQACYIYLAGSKQLELFSLKWF